MIKFTGTSPKGPVYFLGLSRGNVDHLTAGRPIKVDLAELGGPAVSVAILFGETERALFDEVKGAGMIPEAVEYIEVPPGETQVVRGARDDSTPGRDDIPIGPTGRFPEGHLSPDDEGELALVIGRSPGGTIILNFHTPTAWIGMTPDQARQLALQLIRQAGQADGKPFTLEF